VICAYTHYPVAGGASFNGSALVLQCETGQTSSINLGTAYALAFPFKSGYSYTSDGCSTPGNVTATAFVAWGSNACGETDDASYEFNVIRCGPASAATTATSGLPAI
jgi:hypothetical protein